MVEPRGAVSADPDYDWGPGNLGVHEILCSADHEQSEGEPCAVCRACL
jgi:hypothetical protein